MIQILLISCVSTCVSMHYFGTALASWLSGDVVCSLLSSQGVDFPSLSPSVSLRWSDLLCLVCYFI